MHVGLWELAGALERTGAARTCEIGLLIETGLWVFAAKKACQWYRGVFEAAERFTARWHVEEGKKSSERRAAPMRDAQTKTWRVGSNETTAEESKTGTGDRVARHQADK